MNKPILSAVEGKLCIRGRVFEHSELLEAKECLIDIGAINDDFFNNYSEIDEEEIEVIKEIIEKMGRLSPLTWHAFLLDNRA